jgi:hypothetical protein
MSPILNVSKIPASFDTVVLAWIFLTPTTYGGGGSLHSTLMLESNVAVFQAP